MRDVQRLIERYAQLLGPGGLAVAILALAVDTRWLGRKHREDLKSRLDAPCWRKGREGWWWWWGEADATGCDGVLLRGGDSAGAGCPERQTVRQKDYRRWAAPRKSKQQTCSGRSWWRWV